VDILAPDFSTGAFAKTNKRTIQLILLVIVEVERVKGIEPSSQAWEARILPLDHTRFLMCAHLCSK
jgi:hypothetical protein